jgi:O-antigen/teichoic acid export membrane protein
MSVAQKIFSNTIVQIIGKGVIALLSIIAVKILTTYLGTELYGEYNAIYTYLAFFSIIADLGIYTIAVREMARKDEDVPAIIGNILTIRTLLATLSIGAAVMSSFFIPQYAHTFIPIGILISGIGTVIALINGVLVSIFQTYLKMQYATYSLVIGKIVSVVGLAVVAFLLFPEHLIINNPGQLSVAFYLTIAVGIISSIAMVIVTLFYSKKLVKITYRFNPVIWKRLIKESLPYGIALILGTIYIRVDSFLITLINGPEELGIYSVATKVIEVVNVLPILFMSTVLPVLIKYLEEKSDKVQELLKHSFTFLVAIGLPIAIGFIVLAYQIVYIIATPEFLTRTTAGFWGSDIALKILAGALFLSFINNLFIYLLVAINQQKKLLFINSGAVIFNVVSNLIILPAWGFRGASVTTVLSELFVLCFTFYYSRKYIRFALDLPALSKIIVSGLLMGFLVYILKEPIITQFANKGIFFLMALGGFLYVFFLIITKAVTKEHVKMMFSKSKDSISPPPYDS